MTSPPPHDRHFTDAGPKPAKRVTRTAAATCSITQARLCSCVLLCLLAASPDCPAKEAWIAGTAKINITPKERLWMAGYAARKRPAEGTLSELWAKALVLEDTGGERAVLITLDLLRVDADFTRSVKRLLQQRHGLSPAQINLCVSHTHSGPAIGNDPNWYLLRRLNPPQLRLVQQYSEWLKQQLIVLVDHALNARFPAQLSHATSTANFAVNRRHNRESEVPELRREGKLKGPVDHDVPVLVVRDAMSSPRCVVFGYACHATVLDGYQWSADYPGYAQQYLETEHPEITAMFWAGCGGDQNPLPRRALRLAQAYGRSLADCVTTVLRQDRPQKEIPGGLRVTRQQLHLPLNVLPSRQQLLVTANSENIYEADRSRIWLERGTGTLRQGVPYTIQTWHLGDDVHWVFLNGEVTVEYALRLKQQKPGVWVTAYSNAVMAYIPSKNVLAEGGYEADRSMIYYGLPATWKPTIEDLLVEQILTTIP